MNPTIADRLATHRYHAREARRQAFMLGNRPQALRHARLAMCHLLLLRLELSGNAVSTSGVHRTPDEAA